MSQELITRLRKQRELKVSVSGFKFIARRPTDEEAVKLYQEGYDDKDIAARFVIGWEEGITENDIIGGGGSSLVAFDPQLWREWCADRPDFWKPIAKAILEAYTLHAKEIASLSKN